MKPSKTGWSVSAGHIKKINKVMSALNPAGGT